jgi:hypothetical protein
VAQGTESANEEARVQRCSWCRRPVLSQLSVGRPRKYCKRSCRQRDFEARREAQAAGLGSDRLIVERAALHRLRDEVFVLKCAVEDAERDLVGPRQPSSELHDVVVSLIAAARDVISIDDSL